MKKLNIVAIDGPAGSGKSTVSRRVANALGFLYIDTGAMYRALTLKVMNEGLDLNDAARLACLAENLDFRFKYRDNGSLRSFLDKRDVTEKIRSPQVTDNVKHVAKIKNVRKNMVKLQRSMAQNCNGAVLEGRDIGTVVFPDAKYKFYLDAAFDERVKRRYKELKVKGVDIVLDEIRVGVEIRDASDMERKYAPLKKAKGSIYIDTTGMTIDDVVDAIIKEIQKPGSRIFNLLF